MKDDDLSYELIKSLGKIYHSEFHLDVFYQGEIRILTLIASYDEEYGKDKILPSDISRILNMTNPRVSTLLNSLEKKGYIEREFSTIDRRKVYIHMTSKGYEYTYSIVDESSKMFNSMIQNIGEEDTKELIRILNKISG